MFLKELARGAARPSTRRVAMPDIPDVPHAVRIVLRSEVASLSISAQVLLQGAAVAGDPFEDDLAIIAAGMGRDEAVVCFDELLQAGIVNLTGTPGRSMFRHPLVRAAVYQAVGRAWGLRAHARVADAMASRGDLAIARAHHIARSASQGDAGAVAALTEAGHALAARAPATAAEWYQAATRLLAPNETAVRRIPLLIATATALGNSGSLERSECNGPRRDSGSAGPRRPRLAARGGLLRGHRPFAGPPPPGSGSPSGCIPLPPGPGQSRGGGLDDPARLGLRVGGRRG